jgi:hypothetical protein
MGVNKFNIKYDEIQSVLLLLLPLSLIPFILSYASIVPKYSTLFLLIPMFFLFMKNNTIYNNLYSRLMIFIIIFQVFYSGIEALRIVEFGTIARMGNYIVILLMYYIVLSIGNVNKLASLYINMIVFISAFSIISFILAATGLVKPEIAFYRNADEPIYHIFLSFTGVVYEINNHYLIRPAGLFMEPGGLGLYVLYALLLNKVIIKSKKIELYLSIAGFMSFSFAFYISFFIYSFFTFNKYRMFKFYSLLFLFGLIVYSLRDNITIFNTLNELFFSRFSFSIDNGLQGLQTRESMNATSWSSLANAPFFGSIKSYGNIHASIGGFFVEHGIVGTFIYMLNIILLCVIFVKYIINNSYYKLLVIPCLILLSFYHRPFINHILFNLFIIILFEYIRRQSNTNFLSNKINIPNQTIKKEK